MMDSTCCVLCETHAISSLFLQESTRPWHPTRLNFLWHRRREAVSFAVCTHELLAVLRPTQGAKLQMIVRLLVADRTSSRRRSRIETVGDVVSRQQREERSLESLLKRCRELCSIKQKTRAKNWSRHPCIEQRKRFP